MPTGKYRTKGVGGLPDSAWVADGGMGFDVDEDLYRQKGYQPPFEQLPWGKPQEKKDA